MCGRLPQGEPPHRPPHCARRRPPPQPRPPRPGLQARRGRCRRRRRWRVDAGVCIVCAVCTPYATHTGQPAFSQAEFAGPGFSVRGRGWFIACERTGRQVRGLRSGTNRILGARDILGADDCNHDGQRRRLWTHLSNVSSSTAQWSFFLAGAAKASTSEIYQYHQTRKFLGDDGRGFARVNMEGAFAFSTALRV